VGRGAHSCPVVSTPIVLGRGIRRVSDFVCVCLSVCLHSKKKNG